MWDPHSYMRRTWTLFGTKRPRHTQNSICFFFNICLETDPKKIRPVTGEIKMVHVAAVGGFGRPVLLSLLARHNHVTSTHVSAFTSDTLYVYTLYSIQKGNVFNYILLTVLLNGKYSKKITSPSIASVT